MNRPVKNPMPPEFRAKLDQLHHALLTIHKGLLDHERFRYEQTHGPIATPGQTLQLVINDPWFAWLKPLSTLIIQIDELTAANEPFDPSQTRALLAQIRQLLTPDAAGTPFQREYLRALQQSPEVASLHGQWKPLLQPQDPPRQ